MHTLNAVLRLAADFRPIFENLYRKSIFRLFIHDHPD